MFDNETDAFWGFKRHVLLTHWKDFYISNKNYNKVTFLHAVRGAKACQFHYKMGSLDDKISADRLVNPINLLTVH